MPFFCTFYIQFFNISEMGEPPLLILGHSFIRRLNSFITDSTQLDHRFLLHEAAQFKWHGVRGRTVEKKLFAVISMLWSRLPPILWYYGWELLNDLSLLDPLVAASAIEDLVGILYNERNVRQICVCQTRNRENDAAFNARVKALTKYLQVILILEPIPYCFFGGHRGFCNTSQKYFALDGVHLTISCGSISITVVSRGRFKVFAFLGTFWRTAQLVFVTIIYQSCFYFKASRVYYRLVV